MPASNILHATTDPDLLTRLREMLDRSASAESVSVKLVQPEQAVRE